MLDKTNEASEKLYLFKKYIIYYIKQVEYMEIPAGQLKTVTSCDQRWHLTFLVFGNKSGKTPQGVSLRQTKNATSWDCAKCSSHRKLLSCTSEACHLPGGKENTVKAT